MKQCPKCGYERKPKDDQIVTLNECPRCGLIYDKLKKETKTNIAKTADSNLKTCSKCGQLKQKNQFDERYGWIDHSKNIFTIYDALDKALGKNVRESGTNVEPVCKECFDTKDEKELKKHEFLYDLSHFGLILCPKCREWKPKSKFSERYENVIFHQELDNIPEGDIDICEECFDENDEANLQKYEYRFGFKKCSKCGEVKTVNAFVGNHKAKDGLHPACKECIDTGGQFFWLKAIIFIVGVFTILHFVASVGHSIPDDVFPFIFPIAPFIFPIALIVAMIAKAIIRRWKKRRL